MYTIVYDIVYGRKRSYTESITADLGKQKSFSLPSFYRETKSNILTIETAYANHLRNDYKELFQLKRTFYCQS